MTTLEKMALEAKIAQTRQKKLWEGHIAEGGVWQQNHYAGAHPDGLYRGAYAAVAEPVSASLWSRI